MPAHAPCGTRQIRLNALPGPGVIARQPEFCLHTSIYAARLRGQPDAQDARVHNTGTVVLIYGTLDSSAASHPSHPCAVQAPDEQLWRGLQSECARLPVDVFLPQALTREPALQTSVPDTATAVQRTFGHPAAPAPAPGTADMSSAGAECFYLVLPSGLLHWLPGTARLHSSRAALHSLHQIPWPSGQLLLPGSSVMTDATAGQPLPSRHLPPSQWQQQPLQRPPVPSTVSACPGQRALRPASSQATVVPLGATASQEALVLGRPWRLQLHPDP
mmetsp:Transcript_102095/g.181326  ORF Transcript_102095/g.181326 Transcript_102095/m.181326 type:complete len:274 (-) Transcript_102095:2072-2893(-)